MNAQLLVELARSGHQIHALAPLTEAEWRRGDVFAQDHPEVAVTRFLVPIFNTISYRPEPEDYHQALGKQIRKSLPRLIARRRPDVLVIGHEPFVLHILDLDLASAFPCLLTMHSGSLLQRMLDGTYPAAGTQALVRLYQKIDLLVAVSRHFAEDLRRLEFPSCTVIPNPVDLERFAPGPKDEALARELAVSPEDIVVTHLSNLKDIKRPLDLVASAAEALPHNPRLLYVIVGDGPSRGRMEEECRRRQVAGRFRFVGWVDHGRVPAYLNLADLVVMPSEVENRSLVCLEAQACGRLLLASDIPAAREMLVDGATGLLFRKGDVHDLTAQTLRAAADPGLRAALGRQAREAVRVHSLPAAAAAYTAALEEAIRRHRGRAECAERTQGGSP
jgi:glycosyltransferase involved in cell wall biosynthesis